MLLNYYNYSLSRVPCLIINYITEAPLNYSYYGIFSIKVAAIKKKKERKKNIMKIVKFAMW